MRARNVLWSTWHAPRNLPLLPIGFFFFTLFFIIFVSNTGTRKWNKLTILNNCFERSLILNDFCVGFEKLFKSLHQHSNTVDNRRQMKGRPNKITEWLIKVSSEETRRLDNWSTQVCRATLDPSIVRELLQIKRKTRKWLTVANGWHVVSLADLFNLSFSAWCFLFLVFVVSFLSIWSAFFLTPLYIWIHYLLVQKTSSVSLSLRSTYIRIASLCKSFFVFFFQCLFTTRYCTDFHYWCCLYRCKILFVLASFYSGHDKGVVLSWPCCRLIPRPRFWLEDEAKPKHFPIMTVANNGGSTAWITGPGKQPDSQTSRNRSWAKEKISGQTSKQLRTKKT